jgi:acetyl-CoA carboxylase beta subunit
MVGKLNNMELINFLLDNQNCVLVIEINQAMSVTDILNFKIINNYVPKLRK